MKLKFLLTIIFACSLISSFAEVAIAAQCQTVENQEICLVSIRRSAKYYWQYRAQLKIDGKRQPSEKFDCRNTALKTNGDRQSLQKQKRDFVCSIIPKR